MIDSTQPTDNQTKVTLACAATLSTAIILRLSGNGVSGVVGDDYITRTSVASASLNTIATKITN